MAFGNSGRPRTPFWAPGTLPGGESCEGRTGSTREPSAFRAVCFPACLPGAKSEPSRLPRVTERGLLGHHGSVSEHESVRFQAAGADEVFCWLAHGRPVNGRSFSTISPFRCTSGPGVYTERPLPRVKAWEGRKTPPAMGHPGYLKLAVFKPRNSAACTTERLSACGSAKWSEAGKAELGHISRKASAGLVSSPGAPGQSGKTEPWL